MKSILALACVLLLGAQEFKTATPIGKERYIYGLPVSVKKGSRFSKLNLVPGGWELWLVEAGGARPFQFGDRDQPNPTILEKARACTRLHEALSADKGAIELTLVVRRPGNAKGILVRVSMNEWDRSFDYIWRKWMQDPRLIILPLASTQVGSESFQARVDYTEAERLAEVAAYELRKKEESEERAKTPLKLRESFKIAQRWIRLDAGIEKPASADDGYFTGRRTKAAEYQKRAADRMQDQDYFEAHRLLQSASAFTLEAGQGLSAVKSAIAKLDDEDRAKLRTKALQYALALAKDSLADSAEGAAFCLMMSEGDKDAAKIFQQARKKAFAAKEMSKADLDRWTGILGPWTDLAASTELKEDGLYRATGTVSRAGWYTLVESKKDGLKWVFEDKAGIKFAEGDTFTLIVVNDGAKPPSSMPDDLKSLPLLRVVVVR